jgi:hypothetical protein
MKRFPSRMFAGLLTCAVLLGTLLYTLPDESAYADVQTRASLNAPLAATNECQIQLDGDVNDNGTVTGGDVIYLCNFTFKGGPAPMPCYANGDVNCSSTVTSADVIQLVTYTFKSGAPPCDICQNSALALTCQI